MLEKINNIIKNCTNAAIWELVILDHDATEEELTKIKDYFVKTYPWLFPNQAWTVVGKTNEDEDRATIANITGNGNDLVLSNFGFAEGSGYNEEGEYAGYLVTDGVDDKVHSSNFTLGKKFTVVGENEILSNTYANAGIVKMSSFLVFPNSIGVTCYINRQSKGLAIPSKRLKSICSDGRIYYDDWAEAIDVGGNMESNNPTPLFLGYQKNEFTRFAFKNLAIYNNKTLSKEDAIKAYIYLQTLKAK